MHASTTELLSLRDAEPVEARIAQHIERCGVCTRELQRLQAARRRLLALRQMDAPAEAWTRIEQTMRDARASRSVRRLTGIAAAAIAVMGVIVFAIQSERAGRAALTAPLTAKSPASVVGQEHVAQLVARSQELEDLLQALPARPMIERVSTVATIDTIEQRIQWLDFQLSYAPEGSFDDAQSQRLWRERVELMDSLVKVRYAEAGRLSF